MAAIVCIILSFFALATALAMYQDLTSQRGENAPQMDVSALVSIAVILAFATLVATVHASTWDNKELGQKYVCKRVVSALGDWGFQWAPDRTAFSVNDTLGACVPQTRAGWEAAHRKGLLNGMVAMERLDEVLEAQGVGIYERSDVTISAYDLWKEASKYKK